MNATQLALFDPPATEKRCSKCREVKPIAAFCKDKHASDGLKCSCRECSYKSYRAWELQNYEHKRNYWARWREENADRVREYTRNYCELNAERRDRRRRSRQHIINAQARERYRRNPKSAEQSRERARLRRRRNPEVVRQEDRYWRLVRRARRANVQTIRFTRKQLAERWAYYGNRCWLCGDDATATDHVKPLSAGGAHMLCNLRPVCTSCNSRKGGKWPYDKGHHSPEGP